MADPNVKFCSIFNPISLSRGGYVYIIGPHTYWQGHFSSIDIFTKPHGCHTPVATCVNTAIAGTGDAHQDEQERGVVSAGCPAPLGRGPVGQPSTHEKHMSQASEAARGSLKLERAMWGGEEPGEREIVGPPHPGLRKQGWSQRQ